MVPAVEFHEQPGMGADKVRTQAAISGINCASFAIEVRLRFVEFYYLFS